jgi:hypothetical protein
MSGTPVSILIQVAGLVVPELLVELVPIAVVPHDRFRRPRGRRAPRIDHGHV